MISHQKILLVDDEPMILEELSELLDTLDYPCTCANSVEEALDKVAVDDTITLVITDMRMPGRDGIELVRELAADTRRQFEFVVISGHFDGDEEMSGLSRLPVQQLRKPVNIDEVMALLERLTFVS